MDLPPDVAEDLELLCMQICDGRPPSPGLARTLERDVGHLLQRHGLAGARVSATSGPGGTYVQILLRRPQQRVTEVKIKVQ